MPSRHRCPTAPTNSYGSRSSCDSRNILQDHGRVSPIKLSMKLHSSVATRGQRGSSSALHLYPPPGLRRMMDKYTLVLYTVIFSSCSYGNIRNQANSHGLYRLLVARAGLTNSIGATAQPKFPSLPQKLILYMYLPRCMRTVTRPWGLLRVSIR